MMLKIFCMLLTANISANQNKKQGKQMADSWNNLTLEYRIVSLLLHDGESRDILNVYTDRTYKIDPNFFNTQ